jgi:N-acetylneuraminate synthase
MKLIDLATEGGADAAKFQSYKADSLASKNSPSYWDTTEESTKSQHELFKKYDRFDAEDYVKLMQHCKGNGIDFVSTPFDDEAVEFLDPLVPFFKIASADVTNTPFIRKIASKGKPVVLSTGACTLEEIDVAVDTIIRAGCDNVALLHCILSYPTPYYSANLRFIEGLREAYPDHVIGYSDHTLPDDAMTSLITAYLLGADVIEKHFTSDKTLAGNDHYHAMDVNDLKRFFKLLDRITMSLGESTCKKPIEEEQVSRTNARRSLVLKRNMSEGEAIAENDITYKRPGTGISPLHWDDVIGMRVRTNLEEDHIIDWKDLK